MEESKRMLASSSQIPFPSCPANFWVLGPWGTPAIPMAESLILLMAPAVRRRIGEWYTGTSCLPGPYRPGSQTGDGLHGLFVYGLRDILHGERGFGESRDGPGDKIPTILVLRKNRVLPLRSLKRRESTLDRLP